MYRMVPIKIAQKSDLAKSRLHKQNSTKSSFYINRIVPFETQQKTNSEKSRVYKNRMVPSEIVHKWGGDIQTLEKSDGAKSIL